MRLVISLCAVGAVVGVACASMDSQSAGHGDDGSDAGSPMDALPAADVAQGGDAGPILRIAVSPLPLTPDFSSSIHDYYVRCAAGADALTLVVTYAAGSQSSTVTVTPDQAIVVGDYWIRCLPPDFPIVTVATHPDVGSPTPGYYLVNGDKYAVVLDINGTPVWYARGSAVTNVDALTPDTVSFVPNTTGPYGWSTAIRVEFHALDSLTTTTLVTVGSPTDSHELRLLPNGNRLLFTYPIQNHVDLTGLQTFGADENMADCQIQEIDPKGQLVWSWLASDHIDPRKESLEQGSGLINGLPVVDALHCNSIDVDGAGNLLVSARHANAVFYVDRTTGTVLWKMGGSAYNKDGAELLTVTADPQGAFNMQHDARFLPSGNVTVFDNHGAIPGVGYARGVEYALDHTAKTATFVSQYAGTTPSLYEGSFRRYADGHTVIGWGHVPTDARILTEIDAKGDAVLDVAFSDAISYRAVKVAPSQLDIGVLRTTVAK